MTDEERREMLSDLAAGTAAFLEALEGISDEDARRAPAPGRWSVLECAEHVAVVEEYLFERLLEAADGELVTKPDRENRLRRAMTNRARTVAAPEMMLPTGRFATVEEAIRAYQASRERTIRFVESSTSDVWTKITTHPILGKVTAYETLVLLATHPCRHAEQIAEIRGVK